MDINLRKISLKMLHLDIHFCGAKNGSHLEVDQKNLERFGMWLWKEWRKSVAPTVFEEKCYGLK